MFLGMWRPVNLGGTLNPPAFLYICPISKPPFSTCRITAVVSSRNDMTYPSSVQSRNICKPWSRGQREREKNLYPSDSRKSDEDGHCGAWADAELSWDKTHILSNWGWCTVRRLLKGGYFDIIGVSFGRGEWLLRDTQCFPGLHSSPLFPKRELNDKDSPVSAGPASSCLGCILRAGHLCLPTCGKVLTHQCCLEFWGVLGSLALAHEGDYKGPSQEAFCSVWNSKAACAESSWQSLLLITQWGWAEGGWTARLTQCSYSLYKTWSLLLGVGHCPSHDHGVHHQNNQSCKAVGTWTFPLLLHYPDNSNKATVSK